MFCILYFLLCYVVLSCNAYIRCDNPPHKRAEQPTVTKWPDNTIFYEITDVYSADQKEMIRNSLAEVTQLTDNCVKFVERTDNTPAWVRIVNNDG